MESEMKITKKSFKVNILIFTVLLFLKMNSISWAATYFVDFSTGADTNNGTSTSTPWKHSPGDPRATSNANITLSPSDTVVFKGGVTYSFDSSGADDYIEANASGTSGNVITYISGHVYGTPWGSGRAVIDGTNADLTYKTVTGVISLQGYSYITVEGFEIMNQPTISGYLGLISWIGNSGGNIIIDNNKLHNTGNQGIVIQGNYDAEDPSGFIIQNNNIYETNYHGLMLRWGLDDVLVYNNTFDLNGVEVYSGAYEGDNIILAGLGDNAEHTNLIIRGNDFDDTAEDNPSYTGSKGHILLQQDTTGTIVEDNYFHGKPPVGSMLITGPQTDIIIRNNVFHTYNTKYQGTIRFRTDQGASVSHNGIDIFNNTFVGTNRYGGLIYFHDGNSTQSPQFTNVDIRNNIVDAETDASYNYIVYIATEAGNPVVQLSTLTIDYNSYQSDMTKPFYAEGASLNFADWKTYLSDGSASGADANSNFGQVLFLNEASDNFRLSPTDVKALNQGTALSGYTDDKDGTTRPQGTAWDIGAYEYLGDTIAPKRPANLSNVPAK